MARKLIHRIHDTHQYWHLLKSTKAKTNSIFPTPSPFSQRAPIGLYTLCPSKTNHWGWKGEFSWKREACSPFSGHESFIKDATSFQAKPQPSNLQPPGGRKKKKNLLSFRHKGQAANSHSICQYNVSQSKISHSAYRSPHPSVGLQAASWLGCTETQAADHLQSPCLPGTCFLLHAPAEAHCKLAVSAWGQLSESNSLSVKKNPQLEWFLPL